MSPRTFTQVPSLSEPLRLSIEQLPKIVADAFSSREILGVLLIGSCSTGQASYLSDIDLLIVLREGPLKYGRVCAFREQWDRVLLKKGSLSLPVHTNYILPEAFQTHEPAMRKALRNAMIILDPEKILVHKLEKLRREKKP